MKKSIWLAYGIFLVAFLLVSAPANAQEAIVTTSLAANTAVSSTSSTNIPNGLGFFWRGVRERVSLAFTFDTVKKAEKQLQFAEERMRLADLISEKAKDDTKLQVRAEEMVQKANDYISKIEAKKDFFATRKDERTVKLLENTAKHVLNGEEILRKLEKIVPPQAFQKIQENRDAQLKAGRELLRAVSSSTLTKDAKQKIEDIKKRVESRVEEEKEFRTSQVELLKKAESGDAEAKAELIKNRQERVETVDERREDNKQIFEERKEIRKEAQDALKEGRKDIRGGEQDIPEERKYLLNKIKQDIKPIIRPEVRKQIKGKFKESDETVTSQQ